MDFDTQITRTDPARWVPLDDPRSADATSLYRAIISERDPNLSRHPRRPRRIRPGRRVILAVAAGSVAAGLVAGFVIAAQPGTHTAPTTSAQLTARQVLDKAATAVSAQPATVPSANQFLYVKFKSGGISQYWLSISGERNGLMEAYGQPAAEVQGCADGTKKIGNLPATACTPTPAYLPDMPTSPGALLTYLAKNQEAALSEPGNAGEFPNLIGKEIYGLFTNDWLLPDQRAALFRLAAQSSGMTVVNHVTDADGRPGIGVEWSYDGRTSVLIFDVRTYAFLGMNWQDAGVMALLQTAIVNRVGDLP